MTESVKLLRHVFFPHYAEKREELERSGAQFAYYTTAITAGRILDKENPEIWMRGTGVMNDYSEVQHGMTCLKQALQSECGDRLKESLNQCFPGIAEEIFRRFFEWEPYIAIDTFITCFTEHIPENEPFGRLSMWRAYGGECGVAIIFKPDAFFSEANVLGVYASPVAYLDADGIAIEMDRIAERIRENLQYVRGLGDKRVSDVVFEALRFAAICTKHPAFEEEREWRVVATPSLISSENVKQSIKEAGGIPQPILHIKLQEYPHTGMPSLAPASFVERILIGPCQYPDTVRRALGEKLKSLGCPDPFNLVSFTKIPLRANQR